MPESASEVTAAGIARLAGVGRAAVSNWRRRHADFPKPVGGTETSPSFALTDVERWLRDQGKLAEVPLRERVWQQLADHPATAADVLVQAGCALLLVRDRPTTWQELTARSDERMAELLPTALEQALGSRFGDGRTERARLFTGPGRSAGVRPENLVPFLRSTGELAGQLGTRQTYEFLLGRFLDANLRQYTPTPPGPAALMAAIAVRGPGRTVLDPAAGAGTLLCAVEHPAVLCAQDADTGLTALTALRLALRGDATVSARSGDTLRADAFPDVTADAVLCHPPFNERNWGHEELGYDPRWEYGFPARTESELAWVQHALARLRPGGTAVLLMPPAAASRRSGRRIRAGLLRRGALRAVIALPAGAAPPYGIPLHLWVLRKPDAGRSPSPELLFVDTTELAGAGGGRDRLDWQAVHNAVLDAWEPFDGAGAPGRRAEDRAGVSRAVPVIELLDDDVDLAPARHVPPAATGGDADELQRVRDRLANTLKLTGKLTPAPGEPGRAAPGLAAPWPTTTIGELARAGALVIRAGTASAVPGSPGSPGSAGSPGSSGAPGSSVLSGSSGSSGGTVLTEQDVLAGSPPSGVLQEVPAGPESSAVSGDRAGTGGTAEAGTVAGIPAGGVAQAPAPARPDPPARPEEDAVRIQEGDVVVPVHGGGTVVRVVDAATAGAALGRSLQLLRPDPEALDPWFLAGFLRGTANTRQASSYVSTATRLDVRRLQLPRVALADQRRYGERFRALAAFEDALRLAGRLGEQLVQGLYDGLTDGTVQPDGAPRPNRGRRTA
ncbi:N-6 DNA methylase [Streptomyces sp. NPDC051018]|uniref:N-6 DNA methylase n=1 Tax=Streptomyces sp. NPDC051018 TaxID=3365639 RepID=UPI003787A7F3